MHLMDKIFRYYACLYVQRLEREMHESLNSEISQGNGQDRLSLLPNKLSLKVPLNLCDVNIIGFESTVILINCLVQIFQCLDVRDLLKCAQVCHSWKAITQISSLWTEVSAAHLNTLIHIHPCGKEVHLAVLNVLW